MDDIDTVMVTLKFASGLCAVVDCSRVAEYGYDQRVEVMGSIGMATAENQKESNVVVATSTGYQHNFRLYRSLLAMASPKHVYLSRCPCLNSFLSFCCCFG